MHNSPLFQSGNLAHTGLKNRLVVAPLTRVSGAANGDVGPLMPDYYEAFAKGGFGLIITEGTYTDDAYSQGYAHQPGIITDTQLEGWRAIVERVHAAGGKIIMQLMHAGALSQHNEYSRTSKGPSAVRPKGAQMELYRGSGLYKIPAEMTVADIEDVITGFVASAQRAQEAGFDGVEVHGANGYLLDQFLTDYTNTRSDFYGGSIAARIFLTTEITRRVKTAVGGAFVVGVRISQAKVNDYDHKWAGTEDDAAIIFRAIAGVGADYIHTTEHEAWQPAFDEDGSSLAAYAKKYSGLPVIANGGLNNVTEAEAMLAREEADFVSLGRAAIANSDWPNQVFVGTEPSEFSPSLLSPIADIENTLKVLAQVA